MTFFHKLNIGVHRCPSVVFLAFFLFTFCNLPLRPEFGGSGNAIIKQKGEINFGRLANVPFKFTTSSCISESNCGQNLFDSNPNTLWVTDKRNENEWVVIDFGSKRLLSGVETEFAFMSQTPYEVQVLNREVWTTIYTNSKPEKKNKDILVGIDASTIRILFPKNSEVSYTLANLRLLLGETNLTGIDSRLTGFAFPIENGLMPTDDYSLPGAPRKYRNGTHKGLDIGTKMNFFGMNSPVNKETKILSVQDGVVIRSDLNYKPMTETEFKEISAYNQTHPVTFVDRDFGGRQVWIEHKGGIITTYNHLSAIQNGIAVGTKVRKGDTIGYAGNSGLLGEAKQNNDAIHLHFEIWVDGEFLGNDMSLPQIRKLLQYFFSE
jgi:murein DD-endopeptidase MepM/ murein hydrolase activator NlpD